MLPTGLRLAYIVVMVAAGVAVGLVVATHPAWGQAALPPAVWPLGASLAFDVASGLAGRTAGPISVIDRVLGVVTAGLIVTAFQAAAA